MALPSYATPAQRIWHYIYLAMCSIVLFFLVMPLLVVIPISFTATPFLQFTPEMLRLDPDAFSLRWYRIMMGDCSDPTITTVCSDNWKIGALNSLKIGITATVLATTLGILAALGLSRPIMPFRKLIMAMMISPLIVPLIITASGTFFFFARLDLVATFWGLVLAHTILGLPFVVITVTATLVGFDTNLTKAAASLPLLMKSLSFCSLEDLIKLRYRGKCGPACVRKSAPRFFPSQRFWSLCRFVSSPQ